MRTMLISILGLFLVSCSEGVVSPSPTQAPVEVNLLTATPIPPPPVVSNGVLSVYVDARTSPQVLKWSLPKKMGHVTKAYNHDDASSFEPVGNLASLRTQNDHLRVWVEGESILIEFDLNTFSCGRGQLDVSLDDALIFSAVVNYFNSCEPPKVCKECACDKTLCPPPPPKCPDCPPPCKSKWTTTTTKKPCK